MSGYMTASAYVLISLPYTFKLLFGLIVNCCPIMGYRRRPYMVICAGVCTVCCIIMESMPDGDPYYPEYDQAYQTIDQLTQQQRDLINCNAPGSGAKWVALMVIANIGITLNYAASGGIVVEISQREAENVRGTLQILIWLFTDIGFVFASLLVEFGLNSETMAEFLRIHWCQRHHGCLRGSVIRNGFKCIALHRGRTSSRPLNG